MSRHWMLSLIWFQVFASNICHAVKSRTKTGRPALYHYYPPASELKWDYLVHWVQLQWCETVYINCIWVSDLIYCRCISIHFVADPNVALECHKPTEAKIGFDLKMRLQPFVSQPTPHEKAAGYCIPNSPESQPWQRFSTVLHSRKMKLLYVCQRGTLTSLAVARHKFA